jgi:Leucine-rich repeat (LRR) protein
MLFAILTFYFIASASNNLVGTIPPEICFLREELSALDLSGNQLSGTIPDCFMDLTRLRLLRLDHNRLKGTLPAMGLPHLQEFDVSHNHLSGSLNSMFVATSNLSAGSQKFESTLKIMRLNNNRFSGTIPELKGASTLGTLTLTGNHLTGQVPCQSLASYENETSNAENQISPIKTLEVDCEKVTCTCCTNCYKSWCVNDNC